MLRREIGKKQSIDWTDIDCFLAGFAAQHMGKAAFEQMMTGPKAKLSFFWHLDHNTRIRHGRLFSNLYLVIQ